MVDRMMAPKDIHILIPRTCEYVSLHGKRNFAGVTKLRILIWGDYAGLSGWTQCNHQGLYNREAKASKSEIGNVNTKPMAGVMALKTE